MSIPATTAKKLSLSFVSVLFCASCAQVQVKSPASRFISPEAAGKSLGGKVQLFAQSGTEGTVSISNGSIDSELELRNNVSPLAGSLSLGIIERVDFLYYGYADSAPLLGLKFQLLGQPRKEAKKGNQSLAITLGGGTNESEVKDDELFNTNDDVDTSQLNQRLWDASLIYGYRTDDDTLVYASLSLSQQLVDIEVDSPNSSLDGQSIDLQTTNVGLAAGLTRYFETKFASLEVSAQRVDWTDNDAATFAYISAAFGWHWQ